MTTEKTTEVPASRAAVSSTRLLARLVAAPQRTCYSMHECCLCPDTIKLGELYHDGGYGKRAHWKCVERANGRDQR